MPDTTPDSVPARSPRLAVLSPVVRLALGLLLMFSGTLKLGLTDLWGTIKPIDPQSFVFAIKGFELGLPDALTKFLAFAIPWTELIAGLMLVIGLWARGAALVAGLMLLAFTIGIVAVIARHIDVNCPCFGAMKFLCNGPIGPCHIVRNTILMAGAGFIVWAGSGPLSIDRACGRKC